MTGPCLRDANRDATLVALYRGGASMEEIADISGGISRQRVQQLLARNGVTGTHNASNRIDPLKVVAACRKPGVLNWAQVNHAIGQHGGRVAIEGLGILPAIDRLFAIRKLRDKKQRDARQRTELLDKYRALATRLGVVPGIKELIPQNGVPWFTVYNRVFGSMKALREAAGLDTRDQRRGGACRTICKRGHLLAETRNKWNQCGECQKLRHRRARV